MGTTDEHKDSERYGDCSANTTPRRSHSVDALTKTDLTTILNIWSFVVLLVLVVLSPLHWLPGVQPESLHNFRHILLGLYVLTRTVYHLVIGRIRIPVNGSTLTLAVLAVLFSLSFRSFTPPGELVNYIFSIGFGFVVLTNILDEGFNPWHLHTLMTAYIVVVTFEGVYALLMGFLPIPAFALPADVRPYSSPASALSFAAGPNDYSTSIGIALTLTLGTVFRSRLSSRSRSYMLAISTLLLAAMVFAVIASGGHGRGGFIPVVLLVFIVAARHWSDGWWFPLLIISPLLGYFGIFLWIRTFGVSTFVFWLNDFMSNRLLIYDGSIQLMFNYPFGVGFGAFPELYLTPLWYPGQAFNHPIVSPHNFFFTVSIAVGFIGGVSLLYWVVNLSKHTVPILFRRTTDVRFPLAAVVIGVLFTGLSIGRMSPFMMYDMVIWWVAFAGCIAITHE